MARGRLLEIQSLKQLGREGPMHSDERSIYPEFFAAPVRPQMLAGWLAVAGGPTRAPPARVLFALLPGRCADVSEVKISDTRNLLAEETGLLVCRELAIPTT